jgi:hypothetical protein
VGGGWGNIASGAYTTIGGGAFNTADIGSATVGGGYGNYATGIYSTVPGGLSNSAAGGYSFAAGGNSNAASGVYAFVAGRRAKANTDGAFVWADGSDFDFPSPSETNFTPQANNFLVRASGGVIVITGVDAGGLSTAGVRLAPGSGTWASLSDKEAKVQYRSIDPDEILHRVGGLPIGTWRYKSQDPSIRHIGPMAQDFYAAFGVGEDDRHITTIDADGVALAAIQALYQRNQELEATVVELREQMKRFIDYLEARPR